MDLALQPPLVVPPDAAAAARELLDARRAGACVLPCGARRRGGPGAPPARVDRVLSAAALRNVVAWEPGDQTITVQAGLPVSELSALLATRRQWLPACTAPGTVGGLLATAQQGAWDGHHSRLRDRVLGATVALADGTLARGRGRVVKNVAGYDLPRLLVGSLGTLGLIVEVTLRVQPQPPARAALRARFATLAAACAAARALADGPLEPAVLAVLAAPAAPADLLFGVEGGVAGTAARLAAARETLAPQAPLAIDILDADVAAHAVAELDAPAGAVLVQAGTLPAELADVATRAALAATRAGAPARLDLRPATGALGLLWETQPPLVALRDVLALLRAAGHAMLWHAPDALARDWETVWGPPPPDLPLMRRVKQALDPEGVLATGRYVGGL